MALKIVCPCELFAWHKGRMVRCEVFRFEEPALEEVEGGSCNVFFRGPQIGEFDVEVLRFKPASMAGKQR
jgi:hypothetical protein